MKILATLLILVQIASIHSYVSYNWGGNWTVQTYFWPNGSQDSCCIPSSEIMITQFGGVMNISMAIPNTSQCIALGLPSQLVLPNEIANIGVFNDIKNYHTLGIYFPNNNSISLGIYGNCQWILFNPDTSITTNAVYSWHGNWLAHSSYAVTDTDTCCNPMGPIRISQASTNANLTMNFPNDTVCQSLYTNGTITLADENVIGGGFTDFISNGISTAFYNTNNDTISLRFGNCNFVLVKDSLKAVISNLLLIGTVLFYMILQV